MSTASSERGFEIRDLKVDIVGTEIDIVSDIRLKISQGTALGIVGESGSGKTTVAMAALGYARPGTFISAGSAWIGETDLLSLTDRQLRSARGRLASFVPQNPANALSPGMPVRDQILEMIEVHRPDADAVELLRRAWEGAQLPFDESLLRRYPHQLSGGQQQRVAIAMALSCEPKVIVMDEPTTGLDVLTQARLLDVIRSLRAARETTILYVSHDLGVVRSLVDQVVVMYGGRVVETALVDDLFATPRHPYTRRLLEAVPRIHQRRSVLRGIPGSAVEPWNRPSGCPFSPRCEFRIERCDSEMPDYVTALDGDRAAYCWRWRELDTTASVTSVLAARLSTTRNAELGNRDSVPTPLLAIEGLEAGYGRSSIPLLRKASWRTAVSSVSFEVQPGACVAIVGESGSGKTTLARCIAGLHAPTAGVMRFAGIPLGVDAKRRDLAVRRRIQIVFQDPDSSLNPSMTIGTIIQRPLDLFFSLPRRDRRRRVGELLESVHLPAAMAGRMPRELSGGEKQRVALARALAAEPELLICDEVTSALDVAVQASILDLLSELRRLNALTMIFVSHDLAVVRNIADDVIVMKDGEIREHASADTIFDRPHSEYTKDLLIAVPDLEASDYPALDDESAVVA